MSEFTDRVHAALAKVLPNSGINPNGGELKQMASEMAAWFAKEYATLSDAAKTELAKLHSATPTPGKPTIISNVVPVQRGNIAIAADTHAATLAPPPPDDRESASVAKYTRIG